MVAEEEARRLMKLLREETVLVIGEQECLRKLGPDVIDFLVTALQGSDRRQLVNAIGVLEQLGRSRTSNAVSALFALQSHADVWVRMSSVKAIGQLDAAEDANRLIEWLRAEPELLVQIWIVFALGQLGRAEAVEPLLKALQSAENSTLRYTIIRALGELGDPRAVPVILTCLTDEDTRVREEAHLVLLKLGW